MLKPASKTANPIIIIFFNKKFSFLSVHHLITQGITNTKGVGSVLRRINNGYLSNKADKKTKPPHLEGWFLY